MYSEMFEALALALALVKERIKAQYFNFVDHSIYKNSKFLTVLCGVMSFLFQVLKAF